MNASINLYMYHGGTNFGFMSGANGPPYQPIVTSYDYDAPLDESGDPTPKFFAFKSLFAQYLDL
jgi:beta-galactosidase